MEVLDFLQEGLERPPCEAVKVRPNIQHWRFQDHGASVEESSRHGMEPTQDRGFTHLRRYN